MCSRLQGDLIPDALLRLMHPAPVSIAIEVAAPLHCSAACLGR